MEIARRLEWYQDVIGIVHLTLPATTGKSGLQWFHSLKRKGYLVGRTTKDLLLSGDFRPTQGVVYKLAILGTDRFVDDLINDRLNHVGLVWDEVIYRLRMRKSLEGLNIVENKGKNVTQVADILGFVETNPEVACLLRDNLSDEEFRLMGFSQCVTVMHPPMQDRFGVAQLLRVSNRNRIDSDLSLTSKAFDLQSGYVFEVSVQDR